MSPRRSPARSGVSAPAATGPAVSHGIVRAGARRTAHMVLSATSLDDDRCKAVAVSAAPTLRLASFADGFSSGKPAFADGAGALVARGAEAGSGSCAAGPAERDGLSKTGRRSYRHDGRLVEARCGSQARRRPTCAGRRERIPPCPSSSKSTSGRKAAQVLPVVRRTINSLLPLL